MCSLANIRSISLQRKFVSVTAFFSSPMGKKFVSANVAANSAFEADTSTKLSKRTRELYPRLIKKIGGNWGTNMRKISAEFDLTPQSRADAQKARAADFRRWAPRRGCA